MCAMAQPIDSSNSRQTRRRSGEHPDCRAAMQTGPGSNREDSIENCGVPNSTAVRGPEAVP